MIHSFLMIGQSNMAGRGDLLSVPPIENPKLRVLRNGRWQEMFQPVNPDRPTAGVSLAESFADAYSKTHEGISVGLIPCADGGTTLEQWQVGGLLYDHAIYQCRLALRTSNIVGILWHQGESDCMEDRYLNYEENFLKMLEGFRRDLDLQDVPFLVGGLGSFIGGCHPDMGRNYSKVNAILEKIASQQPHMGYVSSEGLESKGDFLHFSSASLREFGLRYFDVFSKLEHEKKIYPEKDETMGCVRSAIEKL